MITGMDKRGSAIIEWKLPPKPCNACWAGIRRCAAMVGSSWPHRWCSGRVWLELSHHPSVIFGIKKEKKHKEGLQTAVCMYFSPWQHASSFQHARVCEGCVPLRRGSVNLFDVTAVKATLVLTPPQRAPAWSQPMWRHVRGCWLKLNMAAWWIHYEKK